MSDIFFDVLVSELLTAEGCTEPIAIALAAAHATKLLKTAPECANVFLSGNIIKNVKSVKIPGSDGLSGIGAAVAMGAFCGDPELELNVLSNVSPESLSAAKAFLADGKITIKKADSTAKLYIKVEICAGGRAAVCEITSEHTLVTLLALDDKIIIQNTANESADERPDLDMERIFEYISTCDVSKYKKILSNMVSKNYKIAEQGLSQEWGIGVGKAIFDAIASGEYANDERNRCAGFAAAGSDARMAGCAAPVVITCGSGNQGMTASLPIIAFCRDNKLPDELLFRSLLFSLFTTIHIKENIGRLSAYCGAVCAAAGVAGALCWLKGGSKVQCFNAVTIVLGNLSGLICDGAKASCALKIASCVTAAYDAAVLSKLGAALRAGEGIIGENVESTIENAVELAVAGMGRTDEVILGIMLR